MSDFTPTITEAQAIDLIVRGVTREQKSEFSRTLAYCKDATNLRGFSVRKLANKAEDLGKISNSDSYQSNVSNANGIMALFEYDLVKFEAWLTETTGSKSLSAIYKAFRQLFTEPKEPKAKPSKDNAKDTDAEAQPLIDVVLSAIPRLTAEERQLVSMLIIELDTAQADVETPQDEPVAA